MGRCVVLTGGGTAGHVYPALAVAEKLRQDGYDVYFAGTPNGIESRIVPAAGFPFKGFEATGFDRSRPISLLKGVFLALKGTKDAKEWFKEIDPVAVVGFGGYVSIPVARAAEKCKIPVIVHEQNSVMGMANKYISKRAEVVCLTYQEADEYVPEGIRHVLTGNPVRSAVTSVTREEGRDYLGIPDHETLLVVFGGSGGARHINDAASALKDRLLGIDGLNVLHITGPKEYDRTLESLRLSEGEAARWRVVAYEDEMPKVLAAADAVVSRAGATSLAEIAARCIPAVLVPYPYATNDHQRINARSYADSGAAIVIDDSELDSEGFVDAVVSIASSTELRDEMRKAAESLGSQDAAGAFQHVIEDVIEGA